MGESIWIKGDIRSNERNKKRRLPMSGSDEVNIDLVSVSNDVFHEELGWHKGISFFWPPKTPLLI